MRRYFILLCAMLLAREAFAFPWYASGDGFRGAKLMTPEERRLHVKRLQAMRGFAECVEYMQAHNIDLDKRAQAAKATLPPVQGDHCEVMRTMGRFR